MSMRRQCCRHCRGIHWILLNTSGQSGDPWVSTWSGTDGMVFSSAVKLDVRPRQCGARCAICSTWFRWKTTLNSCAESSNRNDRQHQADNRRLLVVPTTTTRRNKCTATSASPLWYLNTHTQIVHGRQTIATLSKHLTAASVCLCVMVLKRDFKSAGKKSRKTRRATAAGQLWQSRHN